MYNFRFYYEFVFIALGLAITALAFVPFFHVGWQHLVWHWSAFLAFWLKNVGFISTFLALSPIFLLWVWQ